MLTSFFGNSKPVTLVIAIAYMLVFYLLSFWLFDSLPQDGQAWLRLAALGVALVMAMLVFNFIIRKNVLTAGNSFGIIAMAVLISLIPVLLHGWDKVWSVLCLLFACRRIFSLRSERNLERKILDASLWIGIAGLFSSASVLFVFPLFWSISMRSFSVPRLYIIPLFGLGSVGVLAWTYSLLRYGDNSWLNGRLPELSFDLSPYLEWPLIYSVMTLMILLLLVGLFLAITYNREARKDRPTILLYGICIVTLLLIGALSGKFDGTEWLFPAILLGVGWGNLIDRLKRKEFKEVVLWLLLLLPLLPYLIKISGLQQS
ncbi:hypothetical protein [Aureitalea marina]|uniref:Glycosyltransferase RgtA/B/C/D-like domain-containing protein n=1 Tax=Aureitalea marina TaxID=930804 RepID=A0A2S7KSE5_9FLAO|nr:hypothetical protein [Aureitalea marina]PQB05498.1 hypothetical protein BST85_11795 [Aureitalea marina]